MSEDAEGQVVPSRRGITAVGTANLYGVKHGAYSPFMISQAAAAVAECLIGQYPWFFETDLPGVEQYCRCEGQARLFDEYLAHVMETRGVGAVSTDQFKTGALLNSTAMKAAEALGLTPLGRTRILSAQSMAVHFQTSNVDSLVEEGRALRSGGQ